MPQKITINPVTRISGFMEINADVDNGAVVNAKTKGLMFRGFEQMLVGRNPFDAVYFTERICGICSTAHSMASTLALESVMGIEVTEQGRYLRDIIHGSEFLQNHLRHFFQMTIPDYVKMPQNFPLLNARHNDYRLPKEINDRIVKNYFDSLELSRSAHQMVAIFGGKAPHNHGIFIGGATMQATSDKVISMLSILDSIQTFIEEKMLPDVYDIAKYYPEYYQIGGGYGNLLSYGIFDHYKELGTLYVDPLVYTNGDITPFNPDRIAEVSDYSWCKNLEPQDLYHQPIEDTKDLKAYTWVKTPRYENKPFEVGPLARQWLSGEYRNGISAMDRTIARVLEAKKICAVLKTLLENLRPGINFQQVYEVSVGGKGSGLIDTTRGALGHWVSVENRQILTYQIITPSAWNFCARDDEHPGVAERALIGTPVQDVKDPVEIGRVIRSFDPCISCATHVYTAGQYVKTLEVNV